MSVKWIDTTKLSFKGLLLLERWQIELLSKRPFNKDFAIALKANPEVEWFLRHKCLKVSDWLDKVLSFETTGSNTDGIRKAELTILNEINDWLTYAVNPAIYDNQSFLKWDSAELLSLTDFSNKIVLDIGSGTGKLAFLVADKAKIIYAVEPIENLRYWMKVKAQEKKLNNFYIADGFIESLSFPNDFADIVMSGHVFGDNLEEENQEMERVAKKGGMIIHCPGNNDEDNETHQFLVGHGYEWSRFEEPDDGVKRKYWKIVD
ncbi:MAG: class I SAM-dependent methyltransferase [Minisyncoccia bacterium]